MNNNIRVCDKSDIPDLIEMCRSWCERENLTPFDPIRTRNNLKKVMETENFLCVRDSKGALIAEKSDHIYIAVLVGRIIALWQPDNGYSLLRYFHKWSKDCHYRIIETNDNRAITLFENQGYRIMNRQLVR